MGNRMCRSRRRPVEERLTRPQRLVRQPSDVDYKKLRKLILSQKLAPCFDALDDPDLGDLEECPICFFYFPSLNRSRCCSKGICTECFLQMKPSDITRPVHCPFCKTPYYGVEYRGARTMEEKALEQAEEQKIIEAKIRMQCESQNAVQVMPADQTCSLLEVGGPSSGPDYGRVTSDLGCSSLTHESFDVDGSSAPNTCSRHEELDMDLEEIMVIEAIWQSLQDSRFHPSGTNQTSGSNAIVGLDGGTQEADASTNCLLSSDQAEFSYSDSLAEGVTVDISQRGYSAETYL
ncbi:E3 ubiquitin-protein ligase DA2-like [Phoenix dactylifera]|uniref:E3 ubiquitin-protein ligase DA2-like n=1 Tax=Phoenix dactylifera TaxID=42345 RepID=A0A8B7C1T7_PHODC|nr:E3 ubiquitin-protein ligase DA2-like [Phoenix dactylifera]